MESAYKDLWFNIYQDLKSHGKLYSPRDMKTLEIENYQFTGNPRYRVCNFEERKMSLPYLVKELQWYLKGDLNDTEILKASKFWGTIQNITHPFWNSNYGYYIFKEGQFDYCFNQLMEDKDTRQACIVINRPQVMMSDTKDKICTYAISFRIRNNKLNMSVSMRSNDFILGTQIDYFQFSVIQEMLFVMLRELKYYDLELGTYTHKADSFHIYERHFAQMEEILNNEGENFYEVFTPRITYEEALSLKEGIFRPKFLFSDWCLKKLERKE